MHHEAYEGFGRMLAMSGLDVDHPWTVLDVGGADVNGSVRGYFQLAQFHGLDIAPAPGVDIVADAADPVWLTESARYDIVISTECFEHAQQWRAIICNMSQALHLDGPQLLIATCASDGRPPHGSRGEWGVPAGQFYGNVSPDDLRDELEKWFTEVHVEFQANPGDAYCWARGVR